MGPVLVLGSHEKAGVVEAVKEVTPRLEKEFGIAALDLDGEMDLSEVKADWAIVFGGDGAILSASRRMGVKPIPTLAVNFGRLGFLTEIDADHLEAALDKVRDAKFGVKNRMRLKMTCGDDSAFALNDVVFTTSVTARLIHVGVKIERREALRYSGDGVVLATPTGSTAYSLAAGGPILDPDLEATVITPLAAHTVSQRPLVIPASQRIELFLDEDEKEGVAVVDGQLRRPVHNGDVVVVEKAEHPFPLIRVGSKSYYARLRRILGWGGRPKYS